MQILKRNSRKTVLVADDDAQVLEVVEAILEQEGYQVATSKDGRAALKRLKKQQYDLLVLDVKMPKLSGTRLLGMVRASSRHRETPVILLTAWPVESIQDKKERQLAMMADVHVLKPFKVSTFVEQVRALTNNHTGEQT